MLATDGQGIPLTGIISSASTSEYNLIFPTLDTISIEKRANHPIKKTKTLIADRGYDAKWVREELRRRNITPYIPKRRKQGQKDEPKYNQKIKPFYATRWIIERTISHLGNYRRVLIRWEKLTSTYLGFFHLACIMLCLNWVLK
ncbi:IS5 family transposase [Candidatus Woesebacteria bacterium]|nr:IS5 family transposase [Candidatus Woesebacteria bacterium]